MRAGSPCSKMVAPSTNRTRPRWSPSERRTISTRLRTRQRTPRRLFVDHEASRPLRRLCDRRSKACPATARAGLHRVGIVDTGQRRLGQHERERAGSHDEPAHDGEIDRKGPEPAWCQRAVSNARSRYRGAARRPWPRHRVRFRDPTALWPARASTARAAARPDTARRHRDHLPPNRVEHARPRRRCRDHRRRWSR